MEKELQHYQKVPFTLVKSSWQSQDISKLYHEDALWSNSLDLSWIHNLLFQVTSADETQSPLYLSHQPHWPTASSQSTEQMFTSGPAPGDLTKTLQHQAQQPPTFTRTMRTKLWLHLYRESLVRNRSILIPRFTAEGS